MIRPNGVSLQLRSCTWALSGERGVLVMIFQINSYFRLSKICIQCVVTKNWLLDINYPNSWYWNIIAGNNSAHSMVKHSRVMKSCALINTYSGRGWTTVVVFRRPCIKTKWGSIENEKTWSWRVIKKPTTKTGFEGIYSRKVKGAMLKK